jgi:hypothetical protein
MGAGRRECLQPLFDQALPSILTASAAGFHDALASFVQFLNPSASAGADPKALNERPTKIENPND